MRIVPRWSTSSAAILECDAVMKSLTARGNGIQLAETQTQTQTQTRARTHTHTQTQTHAYTHTCGHTLTHPDARYTLHGSAHNLTRVIDQQNNQRVNASGE
jgi:carbohydrate-binding DOMON domain-containing protein